METLKTVTADKAELTSKPQVVVVETEFGGRYGKEQKRLCDESQSLFGFTEAQAIKFAKQVGSDFGKLLKDTEVKISVGKPNADKQSTIGEACSRKGVTLTNSLTIVRAIQWIKDAEKNGVSYGFTKWQLTRMSEGLDEYIRNL